MFAREYKKRDKSITLCKKRQKPSELHLTRRTNTHTDITEPEWLWNNFYNRNCLQVQLK